MCYYRVHCLDNTGQLAVVRQLECVSDDDVVARAIPLLDVHPSIEIWDGERMVGTFSTTKPP